MAKEQKTNLYLLSIVAIVAIVGIVVLILNSGASSVSLSSDDLSGQATKSATSSLKVGMSSIGTIKIGTGKTAIVVSAADCGSNCDICGCDANGNNCKCQD